MSIFQWRIFGGRTLAYLLDEGEVGMLLDYGPGLGPEEALLILPAFGEGVAVMPDSPAALGGDELATLLDKAAGAPTVLFITDGQAESVRHMSFTTGDGKPVRVALKLLFRMNPAKPLEILTFLGRRQALADADVDARVASAVEEVLAGEILISQLESLDSAAQEAIKQKVVEAVRPLAQEIGLKVGGLGLAWGLDEGRIERMAAAALRSAAEEAAFDVERREAMDELLLRRGLTRADVEESPGAAEFSKIEEPDLSFLSGLDEEAAEEPELAPEVSSRPPPEFEPRAAETFAPAHGGVFTSAREREVTFEPEAGAREEERGFVGAVGGEERGRILGDPEMLGKSLANWHLYGHETVAALLDPETVPRIFRKDFALNPEETAVVLSDGRTVDVLTKGLEKTGTALLWVRRLFCKGQDVRVLFLSTAAHTLVVDLEGIDAARDEVRGKATLEVRFAPGGADMILTLLSEQGRLTLGELEVHLGAELSKMMAGDLRLVVAGAKELKALEASLNYTVRSELARMGLEISSMEYEWVVDRESFERLKEDYDRRMIRRWHDRTRAGLEAINHALYLELRRREDMMALAKLDPGDRSELFRMLLRAAFGALALNRPPPVHGEIETALAASRERIEQLKLRGIKARQKAEGELSRGFTPPPFKAAEMYSTTDAETYLSGPREDEFLGEQGDYDEQRDFFTRGRPSLLKARPPADLEPPGQGGSALKSPLRCPQCMSPVRREDVACSNCGRTL